MLSAELLNQLKSALDEERTKLVTELKAIADPDPKMKGDWDARFPQFQVGPTASHTDREAMEDEVEEYEMRLEAEHSLETRLLKVERALARLKENKFGVCLKCGRELSVERLKADPAAEYHVEHTREGVPK